MLRFEFESFLIYCFKFVSFSLSPFMNITFGMLWCCWNWIFGFLDVKIESFIYIVVDNSFLNSAYICREKSAVNMLVNWRKIWGRCSTKRTQPWRKPRQEARWFFDFYGTSAPAEDFVSSLLYFEKLDYNMMQSIYQDDLKYLSKYVLASQLFIIDIFFLSAF